MGVLKKFFNQTRKPEGTLGIVMLNSMNSGHAGLADWGFTHLPAMKPAAVADIGCGAGRNAAELLKKYPGAHITAVDYSALSVEKAKEYNKEMVAQGRCTVMQGDAADLPLADQSMDLVTAFETVYFWPGPEKSFAQIARILKKGGVFMICNESDGNDRAGKKFEGIIDGMRCYTVEEIKTALTRAGFPSVTGDHHPNKPWITVVAKK